MQTTKEIGDAGEEYAVLFLAENGCQILERNYRAKKLEIDIIVKDKSEMVFVEVKSRGPEFVINPKDAINISKQRKLFEAAEAYLDTRKCDLPVRFDIVEVYFSKYKPKIQWIKDAFRPGW